MNQMGCISLCLAQSLTESFILVKQFLDRGCLVGEIDAENFALLGQIGNILAQLVAI